ALKQQLAVGGRLIIPVGEFGYQTLMRVRRIGKDSFEEEDFGAVAFVPLIGEQGWAEPERVKEAQVDAEPSGFAGGFSSRQSVRLLSTIASAGSWRKRPSPSAI